MTDVRAFRAGDRVLLRDTYGRTWIGTVRSVTPGGPGADDEITVDPVLGEYLIVVSSREISEIRRL